MALAKGRVAKRKAAQARTLITSKERRQFFVWEKRIQKYEKQADWNKSAKLWHKLVTSQGDKPYIEAVVRLSQAYQKLKNHNEALEVLNAAVSTYPRNRQYKIATEEDLRSWKTLSNEKAEISFLERLKDLESYKKQIRSYQKKKKQQSKKQLKIAVFSAVSGSYDTVKPPAVIDPRFDYIVFTDTPVESVSIYEIRPLPYLDGERTRSARFVKTNPHNLLSDYDLAVWIDANLLITGDVYPIIESVLKSGKPFGAMRHAVRTSPYEEMDACISHGRDDAEVINEQRRAYKNEGYATNQLIESNLLVYDLRDKKLDAFLNEWWNQIDRYSYRDQLSINYALDKHGVKWHRITAFPNTVRNHPAFALMDHGLGSDAYRKLMARLGAKLETPKKGMPYIKVKNERLKKQELSISAVVCVHNALEDVKKCLDSVKKHKHERFSLIIVDDGSDNATESYLKKFQQENTDWVTLIRHSKPAGYTKSANTGIKASKADFTIILNSDTIVTDGWAEKMADVAIMNKGVGIVGPLSNAASWQSVPGIESKGDQTAINTLPDGMEPEDMNNYCEKWSCTENIPRLPLVHGFCFGVTREVINAIGGFDEKNFPRAYGEENDYCFRATNAGLHLAVATHTYIYHSKSKSFVSNERKKLMENGMKALRAKHGDRRVDRAIMTMRQNSVLDELRKRFKDLYA
jgi:GT2 family glycosyltransferase